MKTSRLISVVLCALVCFSVRTSARAQNADFPGVKTAMPEEQFESAGLNKLSPEERAELDKFIRGYVSSSSEKAATAAVDKAVKEKKLKVAEPEVIQSNIVGRFTGYDGRSRFTLANGQVWAQSQQVSRSFVPVDSPPVLLTKGTLGWRMYIAGGADIRVSKIR
ncbi:MAG: hypothetical protein ABI992_07745 [Chthoniobacterales bacterium]